jgi:23S rRNA pseudouridine1911/1915/1917 synthase
MTERPETSIDAGQAVSVTVQDEHAGQRVDRVLSALLPEISRSRLQALIRSGQVSGPSGPIGNPGLKVKPAETFTVVVPPPEPAQPQGEIMPLAIAHEDAHLIVIDKPAGLVVHPAAGHAGGTLVNALIAHCGDSLSGIGGVKRPGIVHRLDKETSGLLVVAKTDAAHRGLAEQFASHGADGRLQRTYLALVWGTPSRRVGAIDARVGRSSANRTRMAVVKGEAGRHAVTHFEVTEVLAGSDGKPLASLLRLELETGRTHQIRVHLAHIGNPVMGDPVYAVGFKTSSSKLTPEAREALEMLGRQALHAAEIGFEHPVSGSALHFTSPLPADMQNLIRALRKNSNDGIRGGATRKTRTKVSKR